MQLSGQSSVGEHVNLDAVAGVEVEYDGLRHHGVPVILVVVLETLRRHPLVVVSRVSSGHSE